MAMSKATLLIMLITPVIILCGLSLLALHSIYPPAFTPQLFFVFISVFVILLVASIDYRILTSSYWIWYLVAFILLLLTFLIGTDARGSLRWLTLYGLSIQTSELVKPVLTVFFAGFLTHKLPRNFPQTVKVLLLSIIPIILVFFQPDLGTSIILIGLVFSMFIASGINLKYISGIFLSILLISPLLFLFLKPYQVDRITSFVNPGSDPLGTGYNAIQATIAVGSGGFWGKGLGQGTQSHLRFLPERHTDFIFASYTEELGFIGAMVMITCYAVIAFALISIARRAQADDGSLISLSALIIILSQVFINIGMNIGILPITGITLPFVSAGGSSLLSFSILLGLSTSVLLHSRPSRNTMQIG